MNRSPRIFYHYTNSEGLRGIVKSKAIWASDYRFLNDSSEFRRGISIFNQVFKDFRPLLSADILEIIDRLHCAIDSHFVLIASFCKKPDLLSQWRGYGGGEGYVMGFDGDWLTQNAAEQNFVFAPVRYRRSQQERAISDSLKLLAGMLEAATTPQERWETVQRWWSHAVLVMAVLKNKHFKEEREYRLIQVGRSWPKGICSRSTSNGLVPYLPVKLNRKIIDHPRYHPQNCGIARIVVGPGLRNSQLTALDALLASEHMRLEIGRSGIPYASAH